MKNSVIQHIRSVRGLRRVDSQAISRIHRCHTSGYNLLSLLFCEYTFNLPLTNGRLYRTWSYIPRGNSSFVEWRQSAGKEGEKTERCLLPVCVLKSFISLLTVFWYETQITSRENIWKTWRMSSQVSLPLGCKQILSWCLCCHCGSCVLDYKVASSQDVSWPAGYSTLGWFCCVTRKQKAGNIPATAAVFPFVRLFSEV